jgi:hypothetical protein
MDFYINCYIPSLKKETKINNILFGDYFKLNSYIQNSDYVNANEIFDKICERSFKDSSILKNIDKFSILLHLRDAFLNPILKLSAKDNDNNKISYEILIKQIINVCKEYNINNFDLPKKLYYDDANEIIEETGKSIKDIREHIDSNKFLLFDVPEMIKDVPKVYFNCFDNTLFYFCKLIYTVDLSYFYKKIKILKKDFNFLLSEIYEMHPKELDMFLNTK